MTKSQAIQKINVLLRKWFFLRSGSEFSEGNGTRQNFEDQSEKMVRLLKRERKLFSEIISYVDRCRNSKVTINLHLDELGDHYYRDSVRVRNVIEFVLFIKTFGMPDLVLFEYDVDEERASYECAKFLIIECLEKDVVLPPFKVIGISHNKSKDVEKLLTNFQKRTFYSGANS